MYITRNKDGSINLTAPVMIPGAKDCDYKNGEPPLTANQIKYFKKSYDKYGFVDHEHQLTKNGKKIGVPKNSFLLTKNTTMQTINGEETYPMGTWFMTSTLTDPSSIENALNGGYTGYSPSVLPRQKANEYLKALKSNKKAPLPCSCKNISSQGNALIKDVPDPVVLSVSLVESPCLHQSKFCEISDNMNEDAKSMKSKILDAMGMSEQAEVEALKSEVVDLKSTIEEMQTGFDTALKSMQESFEDTLKLALSQFSEKSEETDTEETEEKVEEEVIEEPTETEEETEVEVEEEVEVKAEKGESKAGHIHDNIEVNKSEVQNIYAFLGRNPDGTRKL